jgi:hypothetical protein
VPLEKRFADGCSSTGELCGFGVEIYLAYNDVSTHVPKEPTGGHLARIEYPTQRA